MKNCPECEKPLPEEVVYCVYCGTKADLPPNIKSERRIFFLTPFFLFIISLAIAYDLSCNSIFEITVILTSILSILYFTGASLLGILRFFFNIDIIPGSYFNAGISSLINGLTLVFTSKTIENIFLSETIEKLGPTTYFINHILLLAVLYFPLQFVETLAISAKAKSILKSKDSLTNFQKFIFAKTYILIPIFLVIFSYLGITTLPKASQIALQSEILLNINAIEKVQKYVDDGLKNFPDDPQLCNLKAIILSQLAVTEPLNLQQENLEKEALKYAEIAVEKKPKSSILKFQLCRILELNQQTAKAIILASEAASIAENDYYLWQYLGDLNQKNLNYSEAISAYKKSLDIEPNNASALNNLAYTLIISNDNLGVAIELAEKSVELAPGSIANRDTLAWGYYKQNRYPEALDTISILYQKNTEITPEIDFHYAAILNKMGLLNNPIETFDKMLVNPEILLNISLRNEIFEERQQTYNNLSEKK